MAIISEDKILYTVNKAFSPILRFLLFLHHVIAQPYDLISVLFLAAAGNQIADEERQ